MEGIDADRDARRQRGAGFPFEPFADRIWQLRNNVSSYDAWYVAVAEELGFPLATLDQRLTEAEGPSCEFMTLPSR